MRRVVVTGIGMVSPLAWGVEKTWAALLASKSGAGRLAPTWSPTPGAISPGIHSVIHSSLRA